MNIENTAHFMLQSKGGAGKSVCSVILAQYLLEKNKNLILIDTDPSNNTLSSYKALPVSVIKVLNKSKIVDKSNFDGFIEDFLNSSEPMLVDTGSSDYLPINSHLIQNEIPEIFEEEGKQLLIHCPINFGKAKDETIHCLVNLLTNYPNTPVVIWENEFFGSNDENLANTALFKKYKNIIGVIKVAEMDADTTKIDFSNMLEASLTFNEVESTEDNRFSFLKKSRLRRIKKGLFEQLDDLFDTIDVDTHANDANVNA